MRAIERQRASKSKTDRENGIKRIKSLVIAAFFAAGEYNCNKRRMRLRSRRSFLSALFLPVCLLLLLHLLLLTLCCVLILRSLTEVIDNPGTTKLFYRSLRTERIEKNVTVRY